MSASKAGVNYGLQQNLAERQQTQHHNAVCTLPMKLECICPCCLWNVWLYNDAGSQHITQYCQTHYIQGQEAAIVMHTITRDHLQPFRATLPSEHYMFLGCLGGGRSLTY